MWVGGSVIQTLLMKTVNTITSEATDSAHLTHTHMVAAYDACELKLRFVASVHRDFLGE